MIAVFSQILGKLLFVKRSASVKVYGEPSLAAWQCGAESC